MNEIKSSQLIRFSLRLWGDRLNTQVVSIALGIEPSYSYEKGHVKKLSSGKLSAPKKLGIWVFEAEVKFSFEDELISLLQKFSGEDLKDIEGVEIAILDIYFGVSDFESILDESYECRLDNSSLLELNKLGLDVRITIT